METLRNQSIMGGFLPGLASNCRRGFSLQMAPMIDIIFLLLLFFLVAAKWRPQESFLPFHLPAADTQQREFGKPEPLVIRILTTQTGCNVQIGQSQIVQIANQTIEEDLAALTGKMRDCMLEQKRFVTDPVEIICQPSVKSRYWVKIYNVLAGLKLTDITISMTE